MESDVTVLCGRLKAVCEASSQTVPALNSAAELHAELTALLKLSSRSVYSPYRICMGPHPWDRALRVELCLTVRQSVYTVCVLVYIHLTTLCPGLPG